MSDWPEGVVRRKLDDGSYEVLFRCDDSFGPPGLAVVISKEEARDLVREHKEDIYEEMFENKPYDRTFHPHMRGGNRLSVASLITGADPPPHACEHLLFQV